MNSTLLYEDILQKYRFSIYDGMNTYIVDAGNVDDAKSLVVAHTGIEKRKLSFTVLLNRSLEAEKKVDESRKPPEYNTLDDQPVTIVPDELAEGAKFDENKIPYHLLSIYSLECTAKVLQFGAKKYAPRNWEKGISWSRVFRACVGHLFDWWRGEELDPETKMPHLWHASCCIMFLVHYDKYKKNFDDRPKNEGK